MKATVSGCRAAAVTWLAALLLAALLTAPLATAWKIAPDLGHGWAAPLLIGYLWWERWSERPVWQPQRFRWTWGILAALLVVAALPLRLLLTPFPLWPALVWAYVLLLVAGALGAAALLAGRPGVRWLGGPLIVLAAALPWGNELEQHIVHPLREVMATITAEVSNLLGRPALAMGTGVRLGNAWVGVDEACGGIRSLEASIMLALFIGEWLRFSGKRRLTLVGLGILAALLGNFLRILFLSVRAGDSTAAFVAAHDIAGWLALTFSLALTSLAAWHWARGRGVPGAAPKAPVRPPASFPAGWGVVPWLLGVTLVLCLEEAAVRIWYAHGAQVVRSVPHWTAQFPVGAPNFQRAPLSDEAREMLVPDHYAAASWDIGINTEAAVFYIEWDKGQAARFVPFLHNPTVCLPLAGCELEESLGDINVRWSGGDIPFHLYTFRRAGEKLAVAFADWDTARGRPLGKALGAPNWLGWFRERWTEVREAREDQPAQVLSAAVGGPDGKTRLLPLLQQIVVARPSGT
jgi:exosortase